MGVNIRRIIWLAGQTCVGKTSLAREVMRHPVSLGLGQGTTAVLVGEACREKFGELTFLEDRNSVTPAVSEDFVRELVRSTITGGNWGSTVDFDTMVVDGLPRNADQVAWLQELCRSLNIMPEVWFCTCEESEWKRRLALRSREDITAHLIQRRLLDEPPIMLQVLLSCIRLGIRVVPLEVSIMSSVDLSVAARDLTVAESKPPVCLKTMFRYHALLGDISTAKLGFTAQNLMDDVKQGRNRPYDRPMLWARRFAERGIVELNEFLAEIPEEWWTEDVVNLEAARTELIDAWHFMMSCAMALGMDAQAFSDCYYRKAEINRARWTSGKYKKHDSSTSKDQPTVPFNTGGVVDGANLIPM